MDVLIYLNSFDPAIMYMLGTIVGMFLAVLVVMLWDRIQRPSKSEAEKISHKLRFG